MQQLNCNDKFAMLTIYNSAIHKRKHIPYIECLCDCGTIKIINVYDLLSGHTKSCGCLAKKQLSNSRRVHGLCKSKIYISWSNMKARCYNKNNPRHKDWGGRGIIVCEEWLNDNGFINFYNWAMNNGYKENLTIDRIDNNGNYEPGNCRWILSSEQNRNQRTNIVLTIFNETKTLIEWSEDERCIVNYHTLKKRINRHWCPEIAITMPSRLGK